MTAPTLTAPATVTPRRALRVAAVPCASCARSVDIQREQLSAGPPENACGPLCSVCQLMHMLRALKATGTARTTTTQARSR